MAKVFVVAVLAVLAASCVALPLAGQEENLVQLQETAGLFPRNDDESTITAEVSEAIQHDVNMDGLNDIGESMKVGTKASAWEKKAAADIENMTRGAIAKIHGDEDDTLMQKFAADVKDAKAAIAEPQKKVDTESQIEHQADEALKDPNVAAQLKQDAAKAQVDFEGSMPVDPLSFFQEDEADDLGEDDEAGDSQLQLMDGSNDDVEKAINAQITQQVNQQIGSIPAETGDVASMQQFEQDKIQAQKYLAAEAAAPKKSASDKIKAQLLAAQSELNEAQATTAEADESESHEEGKEEAKK